MWTTPRAFGKTLPSAHTVAAQKPTRAATATTIIIEAGKLKQEAERARVRHFKKVASGMVEAAREGASDPIQMALKADQKASEPEQESKPISREEAWKRSALEFFNSDWTPLIEAQEAQAQEERDAAQRDRRSGLWCGCVNYCRKRQLRWWFL